MTITSAVVVPHPPLLLRELGGIADPVADLRVACTAALSAALAGAPDGVVVVGPAEPGFDEAAGVDVRRFGTASARTSPGLPQALGVGRRLLDEAGWSGPTELRGLRPDADDADVVALAGLLSSRPGRELLLLMAEGSARRLATGPGLLDERAFGFDDAVLLALRGGDAPALAGIDVDVARDLMVEGRGSFRLLGRLDAPVHAELSYADDPYGVLYPVATWRY
jgi:hypothetical protein